MILITYCSLLIILQFILLILCFVKKTNNIIQKFLWLSPLNILIDILFLKYIEESNYYSTSWESLSRYWSVVLIGLVHITIYIIGLIYYLIRKKRLSSNTTKGSKMTPSTKKFVIIWLILSAILFTVEMTRTQLALHKINEEKKVYAKKAIQLLTKKYGDCDFEVDNMYNIKTETLSIGERSKADYEFEINASLYNYAFTVLMYKDKQGKIKIYNEYFLDTYYQDRYNVDDIPLYVKRAYEKSFTKNVSDKHNVKVTINTHCKDFSEENFGKIPTPEDLYTYITITDLDIELNNVIHSKEQLYKKIVDITKYILNDMDDVTIEQSKNGTIYKFKYMAKNDKNDTTTKDFEDHLSCYDGYAAIKDKSHITITACKEVTTYSIDK